MIVGPKPPYGHAIFCDDLRLEASGKQTFVGVYGSEMFIESDGPAVIQSLWVIMKLQDDPSLYPRNVSFRITKDTEDGSEVLMRRDVEAGGLPDDLETPNAFAEESSVFVELGFGIRLQNLNFDKTCRLRARVYFGEEEVRLGSLHVSIMPAGVENTLQ